MTTLHEFIAGRNPSVQSISPEDVIVGGGTYIFPTAARIHDIESDSGLDTGAGTGARTVLVQGLDVNFDRQEEIVITSGTVPKATMLSYTRINGFAVLTAGSLEDNVGTLTATAQVDGTVTSQIAPGDGNALQAVFTIPNNEFAYQGQFYAGMLIMNASQNTASVRILVRAFGGVFQTLMVIPLVARGTSFVNRLYTFPFEIPAKSDIKMAVGVSTNNTDISAGYDLRLQAP